MEGIGAVGGVGAGCQGASPVNNNLPFNNVAENPQGISAEPKQDCAKVSNIAFVLLDNEAIAKLLILALLAKKEMSESAILLLLKTDQNTLQVLANNCPCIAVSQVSGQNMYSLCGTPPQGFEGNVGLAFSSAPAPAAM